MNLDALIDSDLREKDVNSYLANILKAENERQKNTINLIASENYPSEIVRLIQASSLTSKYTEGYPGKRYYGGCEFYDSLECYCQELWKDVFSTTYHVNVQPHSGTSANLAAISAVVNPGEIILSMSLDCGG